ALVTVVAFAPTFPLGCELDVVVEVDRAGQVFLQCVQEHVPGDVRHARGEADLPGVLTHDPGCSERGVPDGLGGQPGRTQCPDDGVGQEFGHVCAVEVDSRCGPVGHDRAVEVGHRHV